MGSTPIARFFYVMKIVSVDKTSPLFGRVKGGDKLIKVNGHPVRDEIDFFFHNTEDKLVVEVSREGKVSEFILDTIGCGDLGLTFRDSRIKICNNKCIFCFVHQQPKGMRRSLYIKDDDYRYSFMHGNYVSLSRMTDDDFSRIIEQRLSPLYISVHATDDELRRCIFQNEKLEPILPRIKQLTDNGIRIHTQTVICPGINDGNQLRKTIEDLANFQPGVQSLAVVPVGLTKYRERLPKLRPFNANEARQTIDLVEAYHKRFLKEYGSRWVYPADELFLIAGRSIPPLGYYEEFSQWENGVGMLRQFIADFNRRRRFLPIKLSKRLKIVLVSGRAAEGTLRDYIIPYLRRVKNLTAELEIIDNNFWGETVTVTGLLTGRDILQKVRHQKADIIILPPNCLNNDNLFLDDVSLEDFREKIADTVVVGDYNIFNSLKRAFNMGAIKS